MHSGEIVQVAQGDGRGLQRVHKALQHRCGEEAAQVVQFLLLKYATGLSQDNHRSQGGDLLLLPEAVEWEAIP